MLTSAAHELGNGQVLRSSLEVAVHCEVSVDQPWFGAHRVGRVWHIEEILGRGTLSLAKPNSKSLVGLVWHVSAVLRVEIAHRAEGVGLFVGRDAILLVRVLQIRWEHLVVHAGAVVAAHRLLSLFLTIVICKDLGFRLGGSRLRIDKNPAEKLSNLYIRVRKVLHLRDQLWQVLGWNL